MTSGPRFWDTFLLRDELDMLEIRLAELSSVVHRFVLVESATTHRGHSKPLHFAENKERFAPWADRIVHVIAPLPDHPNPWVREHAQRDAALRGLADADDGDVILVSDVDEFPPLPIPEPNPVIAFNQRLLMYAVDWEYPQRHLCSVAARMSLVRKHGLAAVRDGRYGYPQVDGGFHLTWLGGPEGQRHKLAVTCHTEMTDLSKELLASGRCYAEGIHHTGDFFMTPVDVDASWPAWIYERRCPAEWFRPRSAAGAEQHGAA